MDFRSYDPAIGRFNGIDPVTHYSQGTSVAFDNNPIYWADPSGADAFNYDGSTLTINWDEIDGKATWTNPNSSEDDDHVTNPHESEMQRIADDLNLIYDDAYGAKPFTVGIQHRTRKVKVKDGGMFGEDEYKEETYKVYVLKGSIFFNWNTDRYTRMLYDIMYSSTDVTVDIIADKGKRYLNSGVPYATGNGFLSDWKGGYTTGSNMVKISNALSTYSPNGNYNIGGVTLHELLRHIHPDGDIESNSNHLKLFYKLITGGNHKGFQHKNNSIETDRATLIKLKGYK